MNEYRLYFLNRQNHMDGRHDFHAEGDAEARTFAAALYGSCSDVCAGYEIWNFSRLVASTRGGVGIEVGFAAITEISEKMQLLVADALEVLQRREAHLGASKKLLEALVTVRQKQGASVTKVD